MSLPRYNKIQIVKQRRVVLTHIPAGLSFVAGDKTFLVSWMAGIEAE